ncbi:oligosaccharide flippase family protein [Cobetia sp. 10Alg 146]|uniref:oligosaccharide flippase family protein n=1 Tax=Cobetia sp. 10Alg 146 TaxID=3040019 RepID=UPI00244C5651|nr:oligosaccharide flippase family protein [Cobetia sp. 10Alg 146]MDH2292321.1 oligosaccharide flippase family protein [Cobetia sp. 10Alg 146]
MKRITLDRDVLRLFDNLISLSVLKVFNLALPFLMLPYLIKVLGLEVYGLIIMSLSLIQLFQSITDYGFNYFATKQVAQHRSSKKQINYIYSKIMATQLLLILVCLLPYTVAVIYIPQLASHKVFYFVSFVTLIFQTLQPEWFFRGVERMRYITILNLSIKVMLLIGVYLFIKDKDDYILYPVINSVACFVIMLLSHMVLRKKFIVNPVVISIKHVVKTLKIGFSYFVNQFAPNLYNSLANLLVGMILGSNAAGIFGAIRQIVSLLGVLNIVVSTVFYPYLSRNKDKFFVYSLCYIPLFLGACIVLLLLHNIIFDFLGINSSEAFIVMFILVVGVFFIALQSVYSTNYLLINAYANLAMKITLYSSIIGFICIYPLIYNFGLIGAAMGIFLSQFLMGAMAFTSYFKKRKLVSC